MWFQNARARKKKCGANSTQTQQTDSLPQLGEIQEDSAQEFFSNASLNVSIDMAAENESEAWISSPISSHISCSLEGTSIGAFFTQGGLISFRIVTNNNNDFSKL